MKLSPRVQEAVEWYAKNRILYQALARKVESTVREILDLNKINYHNISSRAKKIESYRKKASKEKYKEPRSEIMDMAGIRIITYTDSDARKVSEIVKEAFEIYPEFSVNKSEELGVDKVGYRGIHYVASLGEDRLKLPENVPFKGCVFEIQIRSILQHAWAEFEHDRNYKFSGVLPTDIRRRLSLVSGTLESADMEFNEISEAIDSYTADVKERTGAGDLAVQINSTSLITYMNIKFKPLVEEGFVQPIVHKILIKELSNMGITTLKDLDDIIPKDFIEKSRLFYSKSEIYLSNFTGLLRDVLMIHDIDTYFRESWKKTWQGIEKPAVSLLLSYGVNIRKYIKMYRLDVF